MEPDSGGIVTQGGAPNQALTLSIYRHAALIGGQCIVSSVADPDEPKAPLRLGVLIGSEPERCR